MAAGYASPRSLPSEARRVFDAYADHVARSGPAEERHLDLHVGHCTFVAPSEERFVTAETIAATTMVGPREQIVEQLKELERAGLSQVFVNPPMDGYDECIDELSREVIARM
jgi:alkanesulfonate monooxygenase SsuD/methylene tetrahydromethanopterin reductase-like flavin-dependent oxidoreductase (luciferase family)